jgi:HSP20 family protein
MRSNAAVPPPPAGGGSLGAERRSPVGTCDAQAREEEVSTMATMRNQPPSQTGQPAREGQQQQAQQERERGIQRAEVGRGMARPGYGYGSPFASMRRLMEEFDRMFEGFVGGGTTQDIFAPLESGLTAAAAWSPQIEVMDRNGRLEVRADLPGLKPEDVKVNVEDDVLTISGERKHQHETKEGGVYHCERSYGSFQRSIRLPEGIDPGSVEARFDNGVLEITMPMPKQRERGRSIQVKTGAGPSGDGGQAAAR